jgi:hypothetical protein
MLTNAKILRQPDFMKRNKLRRNDIFYRQRNNIVFSVEMFKGAVSVKKFFDKLQSSVSCNNGALEKNLHIIEIVRLNDSRMGSIFQRNQTPHPQCQQ